MLNAYYFKFVSNIMLGKINMIFGVRLKFNVIFVNFVL
jgi:hypothetical protein